MEVVFAENGRDGIAMLQANPDVDLVLMDIMMPEMDGYETMTAVRKLPQFTQLPIISLTAKAMQGDRDRSIAVGCIRLHHEAGRHGSAPLADAGLAVPLGSSCLCRTGPCRPPSSTACTAPEELETLEIELLLEAVYRRYGFDFREYAQASLKRRLWRRMHAEGVTTVTQLHDRLLHEPACMERLLARSLDQRHRDVPRSVVLRRIPRAGRSGAADVSVHAGLVCRLLHRRGGLLSRDPAERGGPLRPNADLRDRHQRAGARHGARRRVSPRQDAAVHPELHQGGRTSESSPSTTSPHTTAHGSAGRSPRTSSSHNTTSSRIVRSTSST